MSIGSILELLMLGIMSLSIVVIIVAVLKNVPGGKKGTSFRRSKNGG
jgi:hypothetical protein